MAGLLAAAPWQQAVPSWRSWTDVPDAIRTRQRYRVVAGAPLHVAGTCAGYTQHLGDPAVVLVDCLLEEAVDHGPPRITHCPRLELVCVPVALLELATEDFEVGVI
ncbi:MAG TPA: hypothetical protein VNI83_02570 [Vicinamibacterales bacterium]|nr:hypothetical protein [Vicinamibacterales bacterium]